MALVVGADVVEFNIFPVPNIMCNVFELSDLKIFAIGLGGIFVPYLISFLLRPKNFWGWYTKGAVHGDRSKSLEGLAVLDDLADFNIKLHTVFSSFPCRFLYK